MNIARVFLSYSWNDKQLVEKVADALCRRGITPWLDVYYLAAGVDLAEQFKEAIAGQTAIAVFLSEKALKSEWVKDELAEAISLEEKGKKEWILPIFLGDPMKIVDSCDILRVRWLTPGKDRVTRMGIKESLIDPSDTAAVESAAERIADRLTQSVFNLLKIRESDVINIKIDQRGRQQINFKSPLPPNILKEDKPILIFRPAMATGSNNEILTGDEWIRWSRLIKKTLLDDAGAHKPGMKIRVFGAGQFGLAYLLGVCFDRTNRVKLYCYDYWKNFLFTNEDQDFDKPLEGGNPDCEKTAADGSDSLLPPKIEPHRLLSTIALYVGKRDYLGSVKKNIESSANPLPLVFIERAAHYQHTGEVAGLIRDVVALITRFRRDNGVEAVRFYCDLPFFVLPLLAANLTYHVIPSVEFMEFRSDLKEKKKVETGEVYVHLPMP